MLKKIFNKAISFSNFLGNNSFYNVENNENIKIDKKIVFYTLAWGDYLDIYFNYTLPSILHESNIPKLVFEGYEIKFMLYTIDKKENIKNKFGKQIALLGINKFEIIKFETKEKIKSKIANTSIKKILRHCFDNKSMLFMAPPDTIFANSSIYNSANLAYSKRKSFASAHPRINKKILSDYKQLPKEGFESTELVNYSLKNAHSNFKLANEDKSINTVHAGISYKKISDKLFAITANMPTTYIVIPSLEDINYFAKYGTFNDWDRGWLCTLLKKNRLKICGSSDMFFCAEITSEDLSSKVKPKKVKTLWKDLYFKGFSNRISNTFIAIWRI